MREPHQSVVSALGSVYPREVYPREASRNRHMERAS